MNDIIDNISFPQEWDVLKMRQCFSFGKGLSITKDDLVEEGIPVISYGQVHSKDNNGTGLSETLYRYVSESFLRTGKSCLVQKNDFIFADTSEDYAGVGNCVFIDNNGTIFAGYHSIIARPTSNALYPKYLAYLFLTDLWRDQIRANVMGIKVFSITQQLLRDTYICVPPVSEQKRIVELLDESCSKLDKIIANLERQIELLQKYKKSLITETVTKGLDKNVEMKDSGIEWIGIIPEDWKITRLKYCCDVKTGPFGTQLSADEYVDEGIPIVNVKNIGYGTIIADDLDQIPENVKQRLSVHILKEGDIVFGRKGAVDKHAIIDRAHSGWVQGSDCMRIRIHSDIVPEFLNYYFGTFGYSEYVVTNSVGSTMASVNSDILNNSILLIPDVIKQKKIVNYLDSVCNRINSVLSKKGKELDKVRSYKDSLIYEYVTGKKRVKEVV